MSLLLLQDLNGHVVNRSVVENYDAAVRARFDVYTDVLAAVIVAAAEIVAYRLDCCIEFIGNSMHRSVGQTVLEPTELVEGDCL